MIRRDALIANLIPVLSAGAYASGDLLGAGALKISGAVIDTKGLSILRTVVITDKSNQKQAIDLLFFNEDPGNVGTDNAAVDISSAVLASGFIGRVSVATGDYTTVKSATNAEATKNLEMLLAAKTKSVDIWIVPVIRGAATYVGASDLTIKPILERL